MATHSSVLAWKIPWTEEPGRLQSMGLQRVDHGRAHQCIAFCSSLTPTCEGGPPKDRIPSTGPLCGVRHTAGLSAGCLMVPRFRSMHRYKVEQDRCQRSRRGAEPGVSGHGSQSWSQGPRPLLLTCLSGCHVNTLDAGRLACPLQLSTAWSGTDLSVACPKAAAGKQQSVFGAMYKHRFLLTVTAPGTGRGCC